MSKVCPKETAEASSPSLFQNGNVVFQAHHVGWIVATFFTIVATVASFWLVDKHLQWYTNKREQRYIVRLLFMVPIYAVISLASYLWWNHATPLLLIRDAYESTVLTSFFYLLLVYLSPDPDEQRRIFVKYGLSKQADLTATRKGEKLQKWVFPLSFIKWKPADGLLFLQGMKWGVLQYCVLRPLTTLAAVILEYMGIYCEASWGLGWGHVYIVIIVSLSVTVAMYCLIQLYVPVAPILKPHKPLLKLFAVKAVVFLTFWQATFLSVLSMLGVVKDTKYMTAEDINIGIGALLETFEMMLFAFLHIKAFSYKPYRPVSSPDSKEPVPLRTPRLRSLGHAFDFRETFRELWNGWLYLYDKMRGRSPNLDRTFQQTLQYEEVFGRSRQSHPQPGLKQEQGELIGEPRVLRDPDERNNFSFVHGEKRWLEVREGSEDLEVQIENELARRGYGSHIPGRGHIKPVHEEEARVDHTRKRSWWRTLYDRISQSGHEEALDTSSPHKNQRHKSKPRRDSDVNRALLGDYRDSPHQHRVDGVHVDSELEAPPPTSLLVAHRSPFREQDVSGRQDRYHLVHSPTTSPIAKPRPSRGPPDISRPQTRRYDHSEQRQPVSRRSHRRESAFHHAVVSPTTKQSARRQRHTRPEQPTYVSHPSKHKVSKRAVFGLHPEPDPCLRDNRGQIGHPSPTYPQISITNNYRPDFQARMPELYPRHEP